MQKTKDANDLDELLCSIDQLQTYRTIRFLKQSPQEKTSIVADQAGQQYICKVLTTCSDLHPYELLKARACEFAPKVFCCIRAQGELIVIMEKLKGVTLAQFVQDNGPIDTHELIPTFQGVFCALDFLHNTYKTPVIHRDIKPDNIIITAKGSMLIDFGIARTWSQDASCDTSFMGTSGYAAPEQFGFMQTDARSDIFALGKTLRFALTGAAPDQEAQVSPPDLAAVICKASEFDPKHRYASVSELQGAIEKVLQDSTTPRDDGQKEASKQSTSAQREALQEQQAHSQSRQTQAEGKGQAAAYQHTAPPEPVNRRRETAAAANGIYVPQGATVAYRIPPSKRKPSAGWRVVQILVGLCALFTLYVIFDIQLNGDGSGVFTTAVIGLGMCGLPAYYICDPFDMLRKRGAHDKNVVKRFFILMGIGFCIAFASYMFEACVLHTITISS